jgi:formate/nitrite transporter
MVSFLDKHKLNIIGAEHKDSSSSNSPSSPAPKPAMSLERINGYTAEETATLVTRAGVEREALPFSRLVLKSFLGGAFISLGAHCDLLVAAGCPGIRENNPGLATMIAGFTFPLGFVLIILTNAELFTSSLFFMTFTVLQRKTTILGTLRVWVVGYIFNFAGCLFVAGFMCWWSNTLSTDAEKTYAAVQAEGRVNVQWSVNFLRGVGCNWFVGLAAYLAMSCNDHVSKIYSIWIPVWSFVILGYQHCIANYYSIPIGMFYGTNFGVGKFIYQSCIPVTLGNIVGGAIFTGLVFWFLYGRNSPMGLDQGQKLSKERDASTGEPDGSSSRCNTIRGRRISEGGTDMV